MKKLVKLFCGLFLASSLLFGCDEDEDISQKNYLKIGETEYTLSHGTIINYGEVQEEYWQHDGYNIDLRLFSSGITVATDSDGNMNIFGSGQRIFVEMFSSYWSELESGDYTCCSTQPYPVRTFDYGSFCIDWTDNENVENNWTKITSGTITISKSDNEYSIKINCTSEKGEPVTGFFKGSLQYYDYTVKKSASMASIVKSKIIENRF